MSAIVELFRDHPRHAAATALDDDTTGYPPPSRRSAVTDVTLYIAEHRAGPPRGRPRGLDHREQFDELEEAKRACDRWQRSDCKQAILDLSTGERWIRIDVDREWSRTERPPTVC